MLIKANYPLSPGTLLAPVHKREESISLKAGGLGRRDNLLQGFRSENSCAFFWPVEQEGVLGSQRSSPCCQFSAVWVSESSGTGHPA